MKNRFKIPFLPLMVLFFLPGEVFAKIIQIPEDKATIQKGVNAAGSGDTIIISPGTYNGNILFTKGLIIASGFLLSEDESAISGNDTLLNIPDDEC
jgi:hypothetical protein